MTLQQIEVADIDGINAQYHNEVDRIAALSDVYVRPPPSVLDTCNIDPFSEAYTTEMRRWLTKITGKDYDPAFSELADYLEEQVSSDVIKPGLYGFGDSGWMGEMLQSYGSVIRALDVKAGQSILEYGPGEGQIALNLARMGCRVTVTDLERRYLTLIKRQALQLQTDITTIHGPFGRAETGVTYDRILFFEAFHHSLEHHTLLLKLKTQVAAGGMILFAGEPILEEGNYYRPALPYPWGPRLDGLSMRAMKTYGWCELGFTREYFVELLMRNGFLVSFRPNAETARGAAYIARPSGRVVALGSAILIESADHPNCWHDGEGEIRWSRSKTAAIPLDSLSGWRLFTLAIHNYMPLRREITLKIGDHIEHLVLDPGAISEIRLPMGYGSRLELTCEPVRPCDVNPESADVRPLGIAVSQLRYET